MATKKQKRERTEAKRSLYLAEIRQSGLESLQKERLRRQEKELSEWEDNHRKNHSLKKLIEECPHCQILMKANKIPGKKYPRTTISTPRKNRRKTNLKESI